MEALVCAATFPFTFCSAAWFSVEVVRSTIFEEMEGRWRALSLLLHDFAIFKRIHAPSVV